MRKPDPHAATVADAPETRRTTFIRGPHGVREALYSCNHGFFDSMDTEAKAYFLGLLLADGSITKKQVSLEVNVKDIELIEKFAAAIEATHPVKFTKRNSVKIQIGSMRLISRLAEYGVTTRKSFNCSPPEISSVLRRHFWRGCLDGDGSLGIYSRAKWKRPPMYRVYFVGSEKMVAGFLEFVRTLTPDCLSEITPKGRVFAASIYADHARAVFNALYGNSTVFLTRKATAF